MKDYVYYPRRYFFAVTLPAILMFFLLIYGMIRNFQSVTFDIYSMIIMVSVYGLFNNFISLSQPSSIVDDGESLEFHAFGRKHRYEWRKIQYIRIKEFYNRKLYIRIDNPGLFRGRYWIKTSMYDDGDELYEKLSALERKLHPEQLKFRTGMEVKKG
ncbi:hypothetical protein HNQ80_003539 [Anaerosolibacter carboniphilus]|uniref:Uncharacterized protein n=1 Tax=Anaerosolibacter carboniphilus TaxID=1417629 RepID=A0A841KZL4_9FIRM|nr:hypothetical protein [Anaerosolibacter carboniphilus]MBB6217420.1 hypothetical protein [Anaerosolibacter carboniphilus]